MMIAPVEAGSVGPVRLPEMDSAQALENGPTFAQMLGTSVGEINGSLVGADASARVLAAGGKVQVQDVMIAMEQAHLKLQFAVEVRNRVVDAYQNLTNMQL